MLVAVAEGTAAPATEEASASPLTGTSGTGAGVGGATLSAAGVGGTVSAGVGGTVLPGVGGRERRSSFSLRSFSTSSVKTLAAFWRVYRGLPVAGFTPRCLLKLNDALYSDMGGCQNNGPFLGPYYNTAPII